MGLDRGPGGQLLARDAVGEPDVVLDARAGAGLTAGADGIERHRLQALRCAVDGSGQPGRAGSHHDEVEEEAGRKVEREAEVLGELPGRGVAQHGCRRDDHRGVGRAQAHAGQQHADVLGILEVDPGVGQVRTGRERPQRHGLLGVARADDAHGLGRVAVPQELTTGDEGAEDGVGEIGPGAHQVAELLRWDDQHPSGSADPGAEPRPLAGEQAELAEEAALAVAGDDDLLGALAAHDLGLALQDHDEVVGVVAGTEQHLAGLDPTLGAERRELGQRDLVEGGGSRVRLGVRLGVRHGVGHAPAGADGPKRSMRM